MGCPVDTKKTSWPYSSSSSSTSPHQSAVTGNHGMYGNLRHFSNGQLLLCASYRFHRRHRHSLKRTIVIIRRLLAGFSRGRRHPGGPKSHRRMAYKDNSIHQLKSYNPPPLSITSQFGLALLLFASYALLASANTKEVSLGRVHGKAPKRRPVEQAIHGAV